MADEISDALETNATGPASAEADGVSVRQHRLPDQIAADRHARSRAVATDPLSAIHRTVIVPPGA